MTALLLYLGGVALLAWGMAWIADQRHRRHEDYDRRIVKD